MIVVAVVAGFVSGPLSPDGRAEAALGVPAGFVDELVVGGLPYPTAIAFAPDDTMFVALKAGIVRVHRNGQMLPTPFINIADRVHDNSDLGLLGITVHPQFPLQPYVYLLYAHDPVGVHPDGIDPNYSGTTSTPARTAQLMRVEADAATGYTTAKSGTATVILGAGGTRDRIGNENHGRDTSTATCMLPKTANGTPVRDCIPADEDSHTIGSVAFGPDGSLFVSSGDGSNYVGVDPRALRAQNLDSLAGKVLRIDPMTGNGLPDNPFYNAADPGSNRSKVWRAACATRSASRSTPPTVSPTSGTSVGTRGRRSTPGRAPTSAGRATRAAPRTQGTTRAATPRASNSPGTARAVRRVPPVPRSTAKGLARSGRPCTRTTTMRDRVANVGRRVLHRPELPAAVPRCDVHR